MSATAPSNKRTRSRTLPQATRAEEIGVTVTDPRQIREPVSLRVLLTLCSRYMSATDLLLVHSAYITAEAAHRGMQRKSGEPYIEHPLAVATILAELALDAQGIAAALLHDTVEDTTLTLDDVKKQFGPTIANIVDGVTKFVVVHEPLPAEHEATNHSDQTNEIVAARIKREMKARAQSETVRKLFLAMEQEPRVVLLKLADRLHNMRTLDVMSPVQLDRSARETRDIFAPLAGRIGLHLIKTELEDLAFYFMEPEAYAHTVARLRDEEMKRSEWAERTSAAIRKQFQARGLSAVVNWRVKHPYRAYKEAHESGMDIALLHDLIAFRVLVNESLDLHEQYKECYQALEIVHSLWPPYDGRIHDYIAHPKINGYQSLHTTVFGLDGRLAQIHIRTHRMHRAAQHGVAMAWLEPAARGKQVNQQEPLKSLDMPRWVKQLGAWQKELSLSAAAFVETLRRDLLDEQVFVFTPKGDTRELPEGSTALDLAYQIHTDIGSHATGAIVQTTTPDNLMVTRRAPLDYVLQRADVVEITTAADARPELEWLTIAHTRYAREKIGRALRLLQRSDERGMRPLGSEPTVQTDSNVALRLRHPSGKIASIELGGCCYPCPGDTIMGVARRGSNVTIHRTCCRIGLATLERRRSAGLAYSKPLTVFWPEIQPISYRLYLTLESQDHEGLMYEVSRRMAGMGINVFASKAISNQARYKAAITLILDIQPELRQEYVIRQLEKVPGVVRVRRDTRKGCIEA